MAAHGGIVGYQGGGPSIGAGSRGPIPALMEKYGSKMVTDFLKGEKQLREEGKHVAPEYADAYEQKKENFYSRFSRTFIQDVYETRGGSIDISEELQLAGGGPIKSYQSVGDVVGEMSTTGIDPMSDEELELKRQLTALSGSAQGTAMETEAAIEARVEAERKRAAGYLGMTPGEITARQDIIDAERSYQPAQTAYRRAEQAYHEDIASDEEARLREREMLYGILTTPGGVTEMARKSARVRPRFREDRRRATRDVAGSVRDVAGAVRDETVVPAGLDVALASDIRDIQTAIYGEGAEARDTYYTARNQALQSASQLIIGATGREQGERFAAFDAKMKQLDAQLTHEIHLAEMGQADLANLQSMLNVLMQNDTAIDNQYIEITFDQLSNQEVRAAALQWRQLMLDKNSAQKTEVIRLMELMRSGSGRDGGDPTNDLQRILNERITPPDPPVPPPPA